MEFYVEPRNPSSDLGGLCECFIDAREGLHPVALAHVHQHFELLYCLTGSYELIAENRHFVLRAGDVALIHPMEPHQTRTLESGYNSYLVLKFTPDALYSASQPLYELKYIFPYLHFSEHRCYVYTSAQLKTSNLDMLLRRTLEERQQEEYGYEMAVRAYVSHILLWFLRAWHRTRTAAIIDDRSLPRLQRALQYIDDHLVDNLTIAEVAVELGMGQSTFSRFFSSAAGMTFPAYVRTRRLSRAAFLLANTDLPIADIAQETGFSTSSYLILCFRRHYSLTPSHFRKLSLHPDAAAQSGTAADGCRP